MKLPFVDLFKKERRASAPRSQPARSPGVQKSETDRLSKTVMPNSTRTMSGQESSSAFDAALASTAVAAPPAGPRTISFAPKRNTPAGQNKDLPPAVALALEPRVERAISLELADIVKLLPPGLTKPIESLEADHRILLKAAELEKGMAAGKPSVSLVSIYQQLPKIFLQPVPASDTTEISLPFATVMEAFAQMQVRRDQMRDQAVPQVSTPFLQATMEDNERFGTTSAMPALAPESAESLEIPKGQLQLATAETIAAAEPEPTVREKFIPTPPPVELEPEITLNVPHNKEPAVNSSATNGARKSPERIPFHLPPKETGEPAERVPASCGPPVSTSLPRPPEPVRIPFTAPAAGAGSTQKSAAAGQLSSDVGLDDGRKISLALKPILQSLPVFQLTGDPKEVSDDARIELPFLLIQSQLADGRISIAPDLFERALPPNCRRFFCANDIDVPVALPLQEVLKHLPADSLRMRDDQEERQQDASFETPFSIPAAEDAKRFNKAPVPTAKPEPAPAAKKSSAAPAPAAAPVLDAKGVIAQASQLPGVRACALSFADGLNLAGHLPTEIATEGLCAAAPSFLQRLVTHVLDSKVGALEAMTLHCAKSTITFLMRGNVSMAALHANGDLSAEVRNQLSQMLEKLSHTYSQPEASHVHH